MKLVKHGKWRVKENGGEFEISEKRKLKDVQLHASRVVVPLPPVPQPSGDLPIHSGQEEFMGPIPFHRPF